MKSLSFGNLQYLFKLMLPESKTKVIARATGMSPELIDDRFKQSFSEMFDILVAFRNWAAHGVRMYNHRFRRRLSHSPAHSRFNVTHSAYQKHGRGRDDILSFIIALSYLQDRGIAERFIRSVTSEINDYVISFPRHEPMLLSQMNISTALFKEWLHNL